MPAARSQPGLRAPEKQRLQHEAAAPGISVSRCAIDCLREYFAWREEMAAAIDNPGRPGDPHPGEPIQILLARTESRLAAALDARFRDLIGELHLLQSMVDQQAVSYFLHHQRCLQSSRRPPSRAPTDATGTGGGRSSASFGRGA